MNIFSCLWIKNIFLTISLKCIVLQADIEAALFKRNFSGTISLPLHPSVNCVCLLLLCYQVPGRLQSSLFQLACQPLPGNLLPHRSRLLPGRRGQNDHQLDGHLDRVHQRDRVRAAHHAHGYGKNHYIWNQRWVAILNVLECVMTFSYFLWHSYKGHVSVPTWEHCKLVRCGMQKSLDNYIIT